MIHPMDLTGKHILVTGASSGIGQATAIYLSQLGAVVSITARNEERLQATLAQLEGEGHHSFSFDITQLDNMEDFCKKVVATAGAVDGIVYSAGINSLTTVAQLKPEKLNKIMNTNFNSFVELVRLMTKKGRCNLGASIVALSSVASVTGQKGMLAYCASKAAMDAAVRCMALELAQKQIRVNTIRPSRIDTETLRQERQGVGDEGTDLAQECQALGLGHVEDPAAMIAYLLSNAAKFITGTAIAVDGGYLV